MADLVTTIGIDDRDVDRGLDRLEARVRRFELAGNRAQSNSLASIGARESIEIQGLRASADRYLPGSYKEKDELVSRGVAAIRARHDAERAAFGEEQARTATRERFAAEEAEDQIRALQIQAARAQGQQRIADGMQRELEVRRLSRSINANELLDEQSRIRLIDRGTDAIRERYRAQGRFTGASTIAGVARGAIGALGAGVAGVGMVRGAILAAREYAQTNDYLESRIARVRGAQERFSHSLGRDLSLATSEASGGVSALTDAFSRLREIGTNALADLVRSAATMSNQMGNAAGVTGALATQESQDRMLAGIIESQKADRAHAVAMAGITGDRLTAETVSARDSYLDRRSSIEADREARRKAVLDARARTEKSVSGTGDSLLGAAPFAGPFGLVAAAQGAALRGMAPLFGRRYTASETRELASIDDDADRRIGHAAEERDARIARARRGHADRSRAIFELPDRLNSARMTGDAGRVRDIEREIELDRIRSGARDAAIQSGATERDAERFAGESAEARRAEFLREDAADAAEKREMAELARRVVEERQTELEISARLSAGDREGALAMRERAEIAGLTHSINAESLLTEQEKTRAIDEGTRAIRDRYSSERQEMADERTGRYAAAGRRSIDTIDSLRAQSLSASGDDAGAAAIRKRMEIRDLERRIAEDELLSEDRRNALIREGTRLIEERYAAESRTTVGGGTAFADIPIGFGELAGGGRRASGPSVLERRAANRERLRAQLIEDSDVAVDMRGQPVGPSVSINSAAAHRARLASQGGNPPGGAASQSVQVAGVGDVVSLLGDILEKVESVIR